MDVSPFSFPSAISYLHRDSSELANRTKTEEVELNSISGSDEGEPTIFDELERAISREYFNQDNLVNLIWRVMEECDVEDQEKACMVHDDSGYTVAMHVALVQETMLVDRFLRMLEKFSVDAKKQILTAKDEGNYTFPMYMASYLGNATHFMRLLKIMAKRELEEVRLESLKPNCAGGITFVEIARFSSLHENFATSLDDFESGNMSLFQR